MQWPVGLLRHEWQHFFNIFNSVTSCSDIAFSMNRDLKNYVRVNYEGLQKTYSPYMLWCFPVDGSGFAILNLIMLDSSLEEIQS